MLVPMVTGLQSMIEKTTNTLGVENDAESFKKLSIQISLNGLSFFVLDTITQKILLSESIHFKTETTPYLLQKELKEILQKHGLITASFHEVTVVHKSDMFCLVPKPLFDRNELPNYLKFNTKLLANDEITYDELENHDIISVYVPFTNINNFIFDLYGEFNYLHHSTVVLQSFLNQKIGSKPICYGHVGKKSFELGVFDQKKLLLFNQFNYNSKEDFLYYILFTYEQLGLDVELIKLKLFGEIEEDDELFNICYQYLKKVIVFEPAIKDVVFDANDDSSIDFSLLTSL